MVGGGARKRCGTASEGSAGEAPLSVHDMGEDLPGLSRLSQEWGAVTVTSMGEWRRRVIACGDGPRQRP